MFINSGIYFDFFQAVQNGHRFSAVGHHHIFAVFYLALPLAVIMITWGGILIATNSANPSGIKEGKTYIYYAVGGLILVLAAYLIIKTIVNTLSNDEVFELSFNYVVNVII